MLYQPPQAVRRRGASAVELAFLLPLILLLIFAIWDGGRLVEVQQLVSNAAREGARQAATGSMLDGATGAQVNIKTSDVQQTVLNYLSQNGLNTTNVVVQFTDLDNAGATDPYQAQHLDHLRVTVQMPFQDVRWTLINNFTNLNNTVLNGSADWYSMRDIDVSVSTILPTN